MSKRKTKKRVSKQSTVSLEFTFEADLIACSSPNSSVVDNALQDALITSRKIVYERHLRQYMDQIEQLRFNSERTFSLITLELGLSNLNSVFAELVTDMESSKTEGNKSKRNKDADNRSLTRKVLGEVNGCVAARAAKPKNSRRSSSVPRMTNKESDKCGTPLLNKAFKTLKGHQHSASLIQISDNPYMTPVLRKQRGCNNVATVTPRTNVNRAMSVMRRPNAGEMVISMTGSPLLITTDITTPYVNVPVDSENILSIFPRDGFSSHDLPELSKATKDQLKILREHLNKMCLNIN